MNGIYILILECPHTFFENNLIILQVSLTKVGQCVLLQRAYHLVLVWFHNSHFHFKLATNFIVPQVDNGLGLSIITL